MAKPPIRDLTASDEAYRLLVEAVEDYAIFMLDPDGHVASWNAGAQRIKGYSAEEIVGQHFSVFYPPEDIRSGKPSRELEGARANGRLEDEGWRVRKDGSRFWANVVIAALIDERGEVWGFAKVTRDLTQLRATEEFRARFIANAAHEIRTPISTIIGFAEVLKAWDRMTDEQIQASVGALNRGADRLGSLINNLLDLTRLEQGQLEFQLQHVRIGSIARQALEVAPPPDGKRVDVDVEENAIVLAEPDRIQQILVNFFSNAYRYGGDNILLKGTVDDDLVQLIVADDGPGVAPEVAANLFEPFTRGRSPGSTGSGLGLSIVRALVEALGGTIKYSSNEPHGARFIVTLKKAR